MKNNSNLLTSNNKQSIKNILTIGLFAVLIISSLFSNGLIISQASVSDNTTIVNNTSTTTIDNATLTVVANQNSIPTGSQVTVTATVTDATNLQNIPTGTITWSDGSAGGVFSSSSCTLASGTCTTSYTSSTTSPNSIIITGSYGGDTTHHTSSATLSLAIITMHSTSVIITPNPSSYVIGNTLTFTATVTDTSSLPTTPSGIVSWSDGSAGGVFSSSSCTLASGTCTTSYTSSTTSPNSITITGSYGGDSLHQTNSGISQLSHTLDTSSVLVTSSKSIISSGGQVTVTATVTDATNSQNIPIGTITWSDGSVGGIFSSPSCNLSSGTCNVTYTASSNIQNSITVNATYSGDSNHAINSGKVIMTTSSLSSTSVAVSPNSSSYVIGNTLTFTATVTDTSSLPTTPSGIVSWSDGGVGGTFSLPSCTLAPGTCTTSYTPSSASPSNVAITASYGGDTTHQTSSGKSNLTVSTIHATTLSVKSNPPAVPPSGSVNVTATVTDSSSSSITPTSSVSWSDGNHGGVFSPSSCTLASGSCTVLYTPPENPPNAISINATYNGDNAHQASTGSFQLSTNSLDPITLTITPNPATFSAGTQVTFTATIADKINPSSNIIGLVKWTDNGAGGSFSPDVCIISSNHCSLAYTPPSNPSNSITISASYEGDTTHSGSSATSILSVNVISSSSSQLSTTKSNTSSVQSSPVTQPSTTQSPSQSAPVTQPSTTSSSTQSEPVTQPSTTQSPSQSAPVTQPSTPPVKSNTQSTTQSTSQNSIHTSETSKSNNQQSQQNPIAEIGQVINKIVSELEALFDKI